jgi:hypothetical protein
MDKDKLIQELILKGYRMTVEEGRLSATRTAGLCKLLEYVVPEGPMRGGIKTLRKQCRAHEKMYTEQSERFKLMLDHLQDDTLDLDVMRGLFGDVDEKEPPRPPTFCEWLLSTKSEELGCLRQAIAVSISEGYLRLASNADDVLLDMTENGADPTAFPDLEAARAEFYKFLLPIHRKAGPWVRQEVPGRGDVWHRYNLDAQTVASAEGTTVPLVRAAMHSADERLAAGGWIVEHEVSWYGCEQCVWMGDPGVGMKNQCPSCQAKLQFYRGTIYEYLQIESGRVKQDG